MAAPKTFLRFNLPPALRSRTLRVLSRIDAAPDPTRLAEDLCSLVVSLTEAGMDSYFLEAVRKAKLGFVARQTAGLGVGGAVRVMSPIVRSVLGSADADQLRGVSKHIRSLMS
jgi:hypothetical protein